MSAIENCRTAALGGHVARCEDCAYTTIAYNSCRNRHCPKCQGAAAKEWLAAREADLLPVPYYHVVFTLPGPIAAIAYQNKAVIYDLLFKASAETMVTIAADPKHLGARVGITSVLHTWGSAMTHPPHIHMIVPGGGISLDGKSWIACRPGFFLPVRVLSRLFRRLLLEKLEPIDGRFSICAGGSCFAEAEVTGPAISALKKVSIAAIAKETLLENARLLAPGDIIGFTSRRASLDYYHTGLVAFGKDGELLLRNAGRVLTRGQLIDRVWGSDYVGDTKTLDVHVKRLRAKIEPDPGNPKYLVTVRGLGYKFEI